VDATTGVGAGGFGAGGFGAGGVGAGGVGAGATTGGVGDRVGAGFGGQAHAGELAIAIAVPSPASSMVTFGVRLRRT
jgi:hypothetical protein